MLLWFRYSQVLMWLWCGCGVGLLLLVWLFVLGFGDDNDGKQVISFVDDFGIPTWELMSCLVKLVLMVQRLARRD